MQQQQVPASPVTLSFFNLFKNSSAFIKMPFKLYLCICAIRVIFLLCTVVIMNYATEKKLSTVIMMMDWAQFAFIILSTLHFQCTFKEDTLDMNQKSWLLYIFNALTIVIPIIELVYMCLLIAGIVDERDKAYAYFIIMDGNIICIITVTYMIGKHFFNFDNLKTNNVQQNLEEAVEVPEPELSAVECGICMQNVPYTTKLVKACSSPQCNKAQNICEPCFEQNKARGFNVCPFCKQSLVRNPSYEFPPKNLATVPETTSIETAHAVTVFVENAHVASVMETIIEIDTEIDTTYIYLEDDVFVNLSYV